MVRVLLSELKNDFLMTVWPSVHTTQKEFISFFKVFSKVNC